MKKILLTAALVIAGLTGAHAETLSPEAALARLGGNSQMPAKVRALTTNTPQLQSTFNMPDGAPGVYLFGKDNTWMAVSADTRAQALLGYGEGNATGEIPPAMQYWMDFYAREMAAAPDAAMAGTPTTRADRVNIEPMIKTTWDQEAPYNNLCPMLGNSRTLTGCVATAMAQIANYHRWPAKGVGSHSYSYQSGNKTYNESFDFGNTTFDYDNMLDSYLNGYNSTQANAVATLMKACGVMCDMIYSTVASGATDISAAAGMVTYMNYSTASALEMRDCYYAAQWEQMIYDQLSAGNPLPYGGSTAQQEGHEFICDGYRDGYFHFNWGWSGMSDGYFLLSSLNPSTQGAGGAASNMAFNYNQSCVSNLRPPKDGDKVKAQIWADSFASGSSSYNRKSGASVRINGGFYSTSTSTLNSLTIGLQLVGEGDNVVYAGVATVPTFGPGYGFNNYTVPSKDLPVGTWKVVPAFKYDGTWYAMNYNPTKYAPMEFTVTEDKVTVTEGTPVPDPDVLSFVSEFKGWSTDDLVINQTAKFTFDVTASQDAELTFQPLLLDANASMKARSTSKKVTLKANEAQSLEFNIKFPTTLNTNTTYYLTNAYIDAATNSYICIGNLIPVKVVTESGIEGIEAEGATVLRTYDLQGRPVANPANGIFLQRMSDGSVKRVFIP